MPPEAITLMERVGLPVALVLMALLAGARGVWDWSRTIKQERADRARERDEWGAERLRWQQALDYERSEFRRQLAEEREHTREWREAARENANLTDRALR